MKHNQSGYRCRIKSVRKRKTVRGEIVSNQIAVLNCVVVEEGEISKLSDGIREQTHLPKRKDNVRKVFGLEDVPDNELREKVIEVIKSGLTEEQLKDFKEPKLKITGLKEGPRTRNKNMKWPIEAKKYRPKTK